LSKAAAKVLLFSELTKFFCIFFQKKCIFVLRSLQISLIIIFFFLFIRHCNWERIGIRQTIQSVSSLHVRTFLACGACGILSYIRSSLADRQYRTARPASPPHRVTSLVIYIVHSLGCHPVSFVRYPALNAGCRLWRYIYRH